MDRMSFDESLFGAPRRACLLLGLSRLLVALRCPACTLTLVWLFVAVQIQVGVRACATNAGTHPGGKRRSLHGGNDLSGMPDPKRSRVCRCMHPHLVESQPVACFLALPTRSCFVCVATRSIVVGDGRPSVRNARAALQSRNMRRRRPRLTCASPRTSRTLFVFCAVSCVVVSCVATCRAIDVLAR